MHFSLLEEIASAHEIDVTFVIDVSCDITYKQCTNVLDFVASNVENTISGGSDVGIILYQHIQIQYQYY